MHYLLATLIFCISEIAGAALQDTNSNLVCGTQTPPAALLDMATSMANWKSKAVNVETSLEINLYLHLIVSEAKAGTVTQQMLDDQVRLLQPVHLKILTLCSPFGTTADPPSSSA